MVSNIFKHFSGAKITFDGEDAFDFLQRLSAQDILLADNNLVQGIFLDKRARVIGPFYCIRDEYYRLIISDEFKNDVISYIEKMHFSEDLKFSVENIVWTEERYTDAPTEVAAHKLTDWSLDVVYKGVFYEKVLADDMKHEFERLSYMAKSPGIDNVCFKSIMILDGPFDHFISRNKGCYPGQEVVEKIYQNRRPKEMFVCHIESQLDTTGRYSLFSKSRKIGELLSSIPDENVGCSIALAFVRSNKFKVGDMLDTEDGLIVKLVGKTSVSFE